MNKKQISLTIESRLENVSLVSTAVNNICTQIPLTPEEAHIIELCVTEAVVNSIKHAYRNIRDKKVEVTLEIDSRHITIAVSDTGQPMEPRQLENTSSIDTEYNHQDFNSIPVSGRGLMIIKSHMDSVRYESNGVINTMVMTKYITASKDFT